MLFFLDTANLKEIETGLGWGMVDGITTNPSLIAKEGRKYLETVREIAALVPGPVSGEVLATDLPGMLREAHQLAELGDNVVIKVPLSPAGLSASRELADQGIATNVTLCFSPAQALLAAKAGAAYISPFVGRIDDVGGDGMELVAQIIEIYGHYAFETRVLVASIRHPQHVVQAAMMGADVATVPFAVLAQLYRHPLTDAGVERFLADWRASGGEGFPD